MDEEKEPTPEELEAQTDNIPESEDGESVDAGDSEGTPADIENVPAE